MYKIAVCTVVAALHIKLGIYQKGDITQHDTA